MTLLTHRTPAVEVQPVIQTGTSVHGLVELSRLSAEGSDDPGLQQALDHVGDKSGETWLHLLGLCLDLDRPSGFDQLVERIAAMEALDFRRVLLGLTAWSWRSIVGAETIEAAARGDDTAAKRLLSDDRYYGRSAEAALTKILPLNAEQTRDRLLEAMEAYHSARDLEQLAGPLEAAIREVKSLAVEEGWIEAVEQLCGYRYVPEPEARRVAVMPHLAGAGLTLAQHEDTRLIVYGATPPSETLDYIVEMGKALADPSRVRILAALSAGPLPLGELVELTDLTRSTVHHHLKLLRATGLVSVEGNARSYRYQVSARGKARSIGALEQVMGGAS